MKKVILPVIATGVELVISTIELWGFISEIWEAMWPLGLFIVALGVYPIIFVVFWIVGIVWFLNFITIHVIWKVCEGKNPLTMSIQEILDS